MSSPPVKYARQSSFTDFTTQHPTDQQSGTNLDADFGAALTSINQTVNRLGEIQRSDGKLGNAVVHKDAFDATALALMAGTGVPRGAWLTTTAYIAKDLISQAGIVYICVTTHVAGVFATDLAAGKWMVFAPLQPSVIYMSGFATIELADAQAVASGKALVMDTGYALTALTTLNAKQIVFVGGVITGGAFTLNINGAIVAGDCPIFDRAGAGAINIAKSVSNLAWFDPVGDGVADDAVPLQRWMNSIPSQGAGYINPASSFYKTTAALTRAARFLIRGDGLASRIHYTGAGVGFTAASARWCRNENWYLTGTVAAAGGFYCKSAQQGYSETGFFVDGFTGATAYGKRFSSCWTFNILGGSAKNCTTGILLDDVNDSNGGVNNSFTIRQSDCSGCTIGLDFKSGFRANLEGNDFSGCVSACEIGFNVAGAVFTRSVNFEKNYIEATNGVRVGRTNTSANVPTWIVIANNYLSASGEMVRIYKGDTVEIGENQWGAGTITIDAGVSGTLYKSQQSVTDNATAGQTTYMQPNNIQLAQGNFTTRLIVPILTVATLGAASQGKHAFVTDSNAAMTAGIGAVVAGGGANKVPVFADGTNWRVG